MSQEERDARLGLTGLTGAEREARVRLLTEQVEREAAAARAALQAKRTSRRAAAGASALGQASPEGSYTKALEAFWAAAKQRAGDREGTRLLDEVLLLRRELPAHALIVGINAALKIGSVSTDLVATEARKAIEDTEDTGMDTCVAPHQDE